MTLCPSVSLSTLHLEDSNLWVPSLSGNGTPHTGSIDDGSADRDVLAISHEQNLAEFDFMARIAL